MANNARSLVISTKSILSRTKGKATKAIAKFLCKNKTYFIKFVERFFIETKFICYKFIMVERTRRNISDQSVHQPIILYYTAPVPISDSNVTLTNKCYVPFYYYSSLILHHCTSVSVPVYYCSSAPNRKS